MSLEIKDLDPSEAAQLMKLHTGEKTGFIRVGSKGYFMPHIYKETADQLYNLPLRSDDVFIITYPRSGSTWTQELIWLVANDLNFETAAKINLARRFRFVEYSSLRHPSFAKELIEKNSHSPEKMEMLKHFLESRIDVVARMPSPRFIKSHLPLSLLPPTLLDKTKVVYVARDPRDVAVSYFFLSAQANSSAFVGDFKEFWALFIKDLVYYTPFFGHLKEAWNLRHHPNMLFMFYEDLIKDLPTGIQQVCKLLGKEYSQKDIERLCNHLSFDNFKKNKSVDAPKDIIGVFSDSFEFIRKGKSGGWRAHFDEEMTLEAERWMEENLRDTDMRFPKHN